MKNLDIREGEEMHTALGVSEDQELKADVSANEEVPVSNRRGRKGRSVAARLGGEPFGSPEIPAESGDTHRLTINGVAEVALGRAVDRVNDGFQGGKINRNQLAVWAILKFAENLEELEIKDIRAEHLDEFSAIDAVLRRAKETGQLPPELRAFIQKQMGFDEAPKRKSKKEVA